ncbi:hypothetical protein T310_6032, partial [Rasamsonia emersonii CBS 393.64]
FAKTQVGTVARKRTSRTTHSLLSVTVTPPRKGLDRGQISMVNRCSCGTVDPTEQARDGRQRLEMHRLRKERSRQERTLLKSSIDIWISTTA